MSEKKESNNSELKINKQNRKKVFEMIKHIICLILPVFFAFFGYLISPFLWMLLNKSGIAPEGFKFASAILFFLIPDSIIFIETRTLNPIINITIKDQNK